MKSLKNISKLFFKKILKKKILLLFTIFLVSLIILFNFWNQKYSKKTATVGGEFYEVILGEKARLINPVIAKTKVDRDLVNLIFSPLLKKNDDGEIIENIISLKISDSGKKYTLKLKNNIFFHNGQEMNIDDIFFTLLKIKDPEINSPLRAYFIDAKLKKIDDHVLEISIPEENYYFKEILTKIYILPKNIWEKRKYFDDENNLSPIGSGPFMIDTLIWNEGKKLKDLESIVLKRNDKYWKEASNLNKINFMFFNNIDDFINSDLYEEREDEFINIFSTEKLSSLDDFIEKKIKEPVTFKLTIKNGNSNKFLKNYKIRQYIWGIWNKKDDEIAEQKKSLLKNKDFDWDGLNKLLKYKKEIISFSVIVGGNQDNFLLDITKKLESKLRNFGIDLSIKIVDNNEYYNKLMERDYESIISGYKDEESNLIYYYHSSQRNFPGVNIAQFNSKKIDKILLDLRKNIDKEKRKEKILELKKEIDSYYILLDLEKKESFYYLSKEIKNDTGKILIFEQNRFKDLKDWIVNYKTFLSF